MNQLLITGSSGIAAAAARLASRKQIRVFLIGNREEECSSLAAELP